MRTVRHRPRLFAPWILPAMLALLLAGCGTIRMGTPPATEKLDAELTCGVSDKGDVLRVLGSPHGYGEASVRAAPGKRVIWFYDFVEADAFTGKSRMKFLLVFFAGEKFDGYFWFSSLEGTPAFDRK